MVLLIDNYDSFTFNLYQYLMEICGEVTVLRNDTIDGAGVNELNPKGIVISPGPGHPKDAGNCLEILSATEGRIPVLGVCLGHQAIGLHFGMNIVQAPAIFHGKSSKVRHDGKTLFSGVESEIDVGRYHSLLVERTDLPPVIEISAETSDDGLIMGLRHKQLPIEGIQFHPESIMTPEGKNILRNFINSLEKS